MKNLNIKKLAIKAAVAVVVIALVAYLITPVIVPFIVALKTKALPNIQVANDLIDKGIGSWFGNSFATLQTPLGSKVFLALMGIFAGLLVLYLINERLTTPGRVSDTDSPLGDAHIIKKPREYNKLLDHWDGTSTPKKIGLVIGDSKKGYLYNSAVPHWLVVAKTGAGKTQLMVLETLHLLMESGSNIIVTGKPELFELSTKRALAQDYKQVILDLTGYPGASSFNPLDLVAEYAEIGRDDAAQRAARQIAADLITLENENQKYYPLTARTIIFAIVKMNNSLCDI